MADDSGVGSSESKDLSVSKLQQKIHKEIAGKSIESLAVLYLDMNEMRVEFDARGPEWREKHMAAVYFNQVTDVHLLHRDRLHKVSIHQYDRIVLYDTGEPNELHSIGGELKEAIDSIPGTSLTVRVSIAYERNQTPNISDLLDLAIKNSRQAKSTPGQVLVVKYTK